MDSKKLGSSVETLKLEYNTEIGRRTKKDNHLFKKSRLLSQGEIREIKINYFTRKKQDGWSNWNFQNNAFSNYGRHFSNSEFTVKADFKN